MDEPATAASAPEQPISYSLRQIIAVMTAAGAGIALFYTLLSPPPGSSGLSWATLPAGVLAAALWFCSNDTSPRLAIYAVVASLLSMAFGVIAFSHTDWLFGHGLGMPHLTVASFVTSLIGALTGGLWIMSKFEARHQASASDSVADGGKSPPVRWTGAVAVVPLTLLSCLSVLGGLSSLPRTMQRLDEYNKQRRIQGEWAAVSRERAIERGRKAERLTLRAALLRDMAGTDEVARYQAAATLLVDSVSEERQHRLEAIKILGSPPAGADTAKAVRGLRRVISDVPSEDPSQREAYRSLGRIGSAAAPVVPSLGLTVFSESTHAEERDDALAALAAMGPAAKGAAHHIGRAWQLQRVTLEQAQLLYKIDPQAAAEFNIPRP